jgi:hypothetical protein
MMRSRSELKVIDSKTLEELEFNLSQTVDDAVEKMDIIPIGVMLLIR